jgi:hypothetical protein
MEKETAQKIPHPPRPKPRISFLKKRKKADIRPFVRDKKQRQSKKYIVYFLVFLVGLFLLSGVLYAVRVIVISKFFEQDEKIINPQGTPKPNNDQIEEMITSSGIQITDIQFSTASAVVEFRLKEKTHIALSTDKDIPSQLDMVTAIDRQLISDGKQAISIDLRYNKPIVKF